MTGKTHFRTQPNNHEWKFPIFRFAVIGGVVGVVLLVCLPFIVLCTNRVVAAVIRNQPWSLGSQTVVPG